MQRFTESGRPVGKIWALMIAGGTVAMALTAMALSTASPADKSLVLVINVIVPILLGCFCAILCRETRPLDAFKLVVSASSIGSWGCIGLSLMFAIMAVVTQPFALAPLLGALLCAPLSLLIFVSLVGSGATLGSWIVAWSSNRSSLTTELRK